MHTQTSMALLDSAGIAAAISAADCSRSSATVVGYGFVGQQYVKALRALGVRRIRVCTRSAERVTPLRGDPDIELLTGGFEGMTTMSTPGELAIIGTPTAYLIEAVHKLCDLGFRRLLIEKPVALSADEIERLTENLNQRGVEAAVAYNRVAYPAYHEIRARVAREGGVTSCTYTFTEMIKPNWQETFPPEELARWGIANSLHVMSMAHSLIGLPREYHAHHVRNGRIAWHPAGDVFVGAGVSEYGIPFSYHADWGSTGRWSIELHTQVSSYLLRPLEEVRRRTAPLTEWEKLPLEVFAPDVKPGFAEEVAAMLHPTLQAHIPLFSLSRAAALTRFGEQVFGYDQAPNQNNG